jgi:hypothetical protein
MDQALINIHIWTMGPEEYFLIMAFIVILALLISKNVSQEKKSLIEYRK